MNINLKDKLVGWLKNDQTIFFNETIHFVWPLLDIKLKNQILNLMETNVIPKLPKTLGTLNLRNFTFGTVPIHFNSVSLFNHTDDCVQILLDTIYNGDALINATIGSHICGMKQLKLTSKLVLTLKSLDDLASLSFSVYFLEKPEVRIDFTGVMNVLDFPIISNIVSEIIKNSLAEFMSVTNQMEVNMETPLVSNNDLPIGCLRIVVVSAADLEIKDFVTSDPYCQICFDQPWNFYHSEKVRTKTIKSTLNPKWNQHFDFLVNSRAIKDNNSIRFILRDVDLLKDDYMGNCSLKILDIIENKTNNFNLKLEECKKGELAIKTIWFPAVYGLGQMNMNDEDLPRGFLNVTLGNLRSIDKSDLKFNKEIKAIKCSISYGNDESFVDSAVRTLNYTKKMNIDLSSFTINQVIYSSNCHQIHPMCMCIVLRICFDGYPSEDCTGIAQFLGTTEQIINFKMTNHLVQKTFKLLDNKNNSTNFELTASYTTRLFI